ncbi:MAG TPA: WecB/TagA/CpsF family glycosyltransferase, partial [Rhodoferax sp.]|nr:WecB/TagA/CpsF family glycosyltransferase [Rhodoferax sp.]
MSLTIPIWQHRWRTLLAQIERVHDAEQERRLLARLSRPSRPLVLAFANAHAMNSIAASGSFYDALHAADSVLRDGSGMSTLFRLFGIAPGWNLNGTDLIPRLIQLFDGRSVALFGTREPFLQRGVQAVTADLAPHSPLVCAHGFLDVADYVELASASKPALIVLGMGMPRQEEVAAALRAALEFPCLIVCGGAIIDFLAAKTPRAPLWMRRTGLEWLFRLATEPRRLFRRYVIGNPLFLARALWVRSSGRTGARQQLHQSRLGALASALKVSAENMLARAPGIGYRVLRLYHNLREGKRDRAERLVPPSPGWRLPPPGQVVWVSPERIRLHTNLHHEGHPPNPRDRVFAIGSSVQVADGDWDRSGVALEELPEFRTIKARITEGKDWHRTDFYQLVAQQAQAGDMPWGCRTTADVERRFHRIDALIASVRRFGVLEPREVGKAQDPTGQYPDLIEVNIGRTGELLFQDGRHRLAIAKALGLPRVPVRVRVRHLEWQKFREQLFDLAGSKDESTGSSLLCQRPTHPDLQDIALACDAESRMGALLAHLRVPRGTVLDVGCNLGLFCHYFEKIGFDCVGIEIHPDVARAAGQFARNESRRLQVRVGDILSPDVHNPLLTQQHDLVLALNVLHHALNTRENFERLQILLGKMRPRQMFLELPGADDWQSRNAYARFDDSEFVAFVQHAVGLPIAQPIH